MRLNALLVGLVMCHHADLLLHDQDALTAKLNSLQLVSSVLLDHSEGLPESGVFVPFRSYVRLELLVVLVDLRLAVILDALNFLNKILHQDVNLAAQGLRLFLEARQEFVAEDHLLLD